MIDKLFNSFNDNYVSIYIDLFFFLCYLIPMPERKMYNTTLDIKLLRKFKVLAAQLDKRQNGLLEEAIQDLLKKYSKKEKA
ncbi:MAG: hypothetical protein JRG79_00275 [Deltaproteobacteria bacterium]|nr:hypothetical protein [Deltaproteobacteria bacterium]